MGKLSKILVTLVALVCVVLIGLALFVHFYLTEDRVKALIIPPAEEALGRKVHIGSIDVCLFTGITVRDVSVKEADGKTNFLSTGEFVLRYDLWPLLQGVVVVSEVRLSEPKVWILRDKQGRFNFETLTFLSEREKKTEQMGPEARAALPLALTVGQVKIDRAQVVVRDATGEIPDTDARADLVVALDVGRDPVSLSYKGNLNFVADLVYGEVKPNISGKSDFNQDRLGYAVYVILDDQKARLSGEVKNYAKVPDIRLDITSEVMDIDRLLAVIAGLPSASEAGEKEVTKVSGRPPESTLPPGLRVSGEVSVGRTLYKGLEVKDFLMRYNLRKGILTVEDFSAGVADGQVSSRMKVDFNKPGLIYGGELDVKSVKVQGLLPALENVSGAMVSGTMESHFTFSGADTEWPVLRDALSVEGTYALRHGGFRDIPVTIAIAKLLGLEELKGVSFESLDGTLHIVKGKVALKSRMSGKDVSVRAEGTIGLDGNLDMPVTLLFSPALSQKLQKRALVAKYLTNKEGQTELRLKLAGSLMRPYPALDTAWVSEQVKETIQKKAIEKLNKILTGKKKKAGEEDTDAGKEIIRRILGR
jgi:type II secretion system protein N